MITHDPTDVDAFIPEVAPDLIEALRDQMAVVDQARLNILAAYDAHMEAVEEIQRLWTTLGKDGQ